MKIGKYETHPAADVFPMMAEHALEDLATNIRESGLEQAIVLSQDGRVLDGRNRLAACLAAGVEPKIEVFSGESEVAYVISMNLHRRHMDPSQIAGCTVQFIPLQAAEAKARQVRKPVGSVTQRIGGQNSSRHDGEAVARAAALTGANREYVRVAAKLGAEKLQAVIDGEIKIPQVIREQREAKRETRRQENAAVVAAVAEPAQLVGRARFATITIDPPWDWGDEGDVNQLGRAKPDYATMSIAQLADLPVGELADVDCHLYMWVTNRSLPKGFGLLERWGFRYITALTWVKPSFGMGNYFRGQTEHVLFGVRGSQMLRRRDVGTYFAADRGAGGHSSKPGAFYALVESCSPGPYLEMFSRSARANWTHWGESTSGA